MRRNYVSFRICSPFTLSVPDNTGKVEFRSGDFCRIRFSKYYFGLIVCYRSKRFNMNYFTFTMIIIKGKMHNVASLPEKVSKKEITPTWGNFFVNLWEQR